MDRQVPNNQPLTLAIEGLLDARTPDSEIIETTGIIWPDLDPAAVAIEISRLKDLNSPQDPTIRPRRHQAEEPQDLHELQLISLKALAVDAEPLHDADLWLSLIPDGSYLELAAILQSSRITDPKKRLEFINEKWIPEDPANAEAWRQVQQAHTPAEYEAHQARTAKALHDHALDTYDTYEAAAKLTQDFFGETAGDPQLSFPSDGEEPNSGKTGKHRTFITTFNQHKIRSARKDAPAKWEDYVYLGPLPKPWREPLNTADREKRVYRQVKSWMVEFEDGNGPFFWEAMTDLEYRTFQAACRKRVQRGKETPRGKRYPLEDGQVILVHNDAGRPNTTLLPSTWDELHSLMSRWALATPEGKEISDLRRDEPIGQEYAGNRGDGLKRQALAKEAKKVRETDGKQALKRFIKLFNKYQYPGLVGKKLALNLLKAARRVAEGKYKDLIKLAIEASNPRPNVRTVGQFITKHPKKTLADAAGRLGIKLNRFGNGKKKIDHEHAGQALLEDGFDLRPRDCHLGQDPFEATLELLFAPKEENVTNLVHKGKEESLMYDFRDKEDDPEAVFKTQKAEPLPLLL